MEKGCELIYIFSAFEERQVYSSMYGWKQKYNSDFKF